MPLPPELTLVAKRQEGLVTAMQCRESGLSSGRASRLVDRGLWRSLSPRVFDTAPAPMSARHPDHRRRRAAMFGALEFGPDAIVVGGPALALHGVLGLPPTIQPQIALPGGRRVYSRHHVRARMFDDGMDVIEVEGFTLATVEWALTQLVPETSREVAIACMDSARNLGLLTSGALRRSHARARGRRGVARTHPWWELSDQRAQSPLETRARLDCVDHGIPPDSLQVPVRDAGGVERLGDLGWILDDGSWLIVEIDSNEFHTGAAAIAQDMARHNAITATAQTVLHVRAGDVYTVGKVSGLVRETLAARNNRRGDR
ncbi:hypothetical protein EDD34_2576 [Myceligenerans xiligouense]|uniref:Uncharacterized protein n=2 Tax=Myceligenerans xiligouense TaxID=253184 RepID=A0A3N4YQZ8_9MICO|nr:hypothetical protein EDD34_2576 [Myceligenerans xiligouense]